MKLFFRLRGEGSRYFEAIKWRLRKARSLRTDKDVDVLYIPYELEISLEDVEYFSVGAQAEHDAESAIRALLPKAEPSRAEPPYMQTADEYYNSVYHTEFHTGETTPTSPPEPLKIVKSCLNCRFRYVNEIKCLGAIANANDIPCDDWEAKP